MSTTICLQNKIYITVKETKEEIIDKMADGAILRLNQELQKTHDKKIEQPIIIMRDKIIFFQ
ncbi:MAG: hypothetical protein ACO3UU_10095 [Minisyncoccia bacterium]